VPADEVEVEPLEVEVELLELDVFEHEPTSVS
jgi:hypothetical protein